LNPYENKGNIRTFSKDVDPMELVWHQDKEDRHIEVIDGEGWSIQMDNFDLKKYLAEGKLLKEDMSFDSDIEGKTNKNDFAFWYREGAMGKKQALQAQELLKQKGINADYSKGPFYIDFSNSNVEQRVVMQLLRDVGLTRFVVTND